ncbi:helix-turn-helix domain-containing protein [Larkinella soli]|uniref:helix-turn-helix domain-containing protein n=1 Tax=Larkinella soli TaxID=1770527 RepID=UPI000FFC7AC0|nr:helix-turn-helix transcriptional regulator [Larkinella soli]
MAKHKNIVLVVEKAEDGKLWGRVNYDDNLLVDYADDLETLKVQMTVLLKEFNEVGDPLEWDVRYDLTAFFESHPFLNISRIAEAAGMNPSLLRHYVAGSKHPSAEQVKKIEDAVRQLGQKLVNVSLA